MNQTSRSAWRISLVLVGTVIGAGFASGAEIKAYFASYGEAGLLGASVSGLLFMVGTYCTLRIAYEHKSSDYAAFISDMTGRIPGMLLNILVMLSMLLGYGVMLSGSGAIFAQQWNLPEWTGVCVMAVAVYAALGKGSTGIIAVNRILTPILMVGILLLGIYGLLGGFLAQETAGLLLEPLSVFTARPLENLPAAISSGILYTSYNMLGAVAVLVPLAKELKSPGNAFKAGIYGGIILLLLITILGVATFLNYDTIKDVSIPALELLVKQPFWQKLYALILFGAMYTTALADGFGFISGISQRIRIKEIYLAFGMTLVGMFLSRFGFTALVDRGYRFLGYAGLVQLVLIIFHCISKTGENIHERQRRQERTANNTGRSRK